VELVASPLRQIQKAEPRADPREGDGAADAGRDRSLPGSRGGLKVCFWRRARPRGAGSSDSLWQSDMTLARRQP
jgi:hypothetical protein